MKLKIISDFNLSDPNNFSDNGDIRIPNDQSTIIAGFELSVSQENSNVVLKGTSGIQSFLGLANVILNIFRNNDIIGSVQISTLAVNELNVESFNIIDIGASIGIHTYTLTAELVNPLPEEIVIINAFTFTGKTITPAF